MDPAKGVMMMTSVLWRLNQLADAPGPTWESIYCSRKVACGCGRHGHKVVQGITLFRRLPYHQDVTCSMTIRLSAEAIGIVKAGLGLGSRSALQGQGFVKAASEGLLDGDRARRILAGRTSPAPCLAEDLIASIAKVPGA
jgi:hypothetical protein